MAQTVENLPAMQETWVRSLGWEDALEEGMATPFSTLAFPRTEEPGSYSPWGCKEPDVTERLSGSMLCYRPDFLCHCFQSFLVALHVSTCLF